MSAITLADFLLARIAEDETATIGHPDAHIERERAECQAKRRIVELHEPVKVDDGPAVCAECASDGFAPCGTLRTLATVYADHPDHDESWHP